MSNYHEPVFAEGDLLPTHRWCPKCEQFLLIDEFYLIKKWRVDLTYRLVPSGYCKKCMLRKQKEHRQLIKARRREMEAKSEEALANYVPERWGPPKEPRQSNIPIEQLQSLTEPLSALPQDDFPVEPCSDTDGLPG